VQYWAPLAWLQRNLRLLAMRVSFQRGGYHDDRAAVDLHRLEFVRWLVVHKRISEFPDGSTTAQSTDAG
jgi:hypothetical protein